MAGEYSRELSVKVFTGQCRLIELGYRQGGPPGYGLLDGKTESEIADLLNERGIHTDLGRAWTRGTVHQVLINEKYIGNNVWNRGSFKLKKKRVRNSPEMWIRSEDAFEALVDRTLFDGAQAIIRERSQKLTNEEMLSALQRLLQQRGYLSGLIIDEAEQLPSSSAYQSRFGSLLRAYEKVGYTPHRDYSYVEINRALRRIYPDVVSEIIAGVHKAGGVVIQDPATDLLNINGEFTASVVVVRCFATMSGALRWQIRFDTGLWPDITVAIRMDQPNRGPLDYYLLPRIDMTEPRLRLAEDNGVSLDSYRFDTLDAFYGLTARTNLLEVA